MTGDPFDAFQRACRRSIRDYIRDFSKVPALYGAVAHDPAHPTRLWVMPNLHLLEDGIAVRAHIEAELRRRRSRYAAYGSLKDIEDHGHVFFLVCVTLDENECERLAKWMAPVSARGVDGWTRGTFRPGDYGFIVRTIQETLGATT